MVLHQSDNVVSLGLREHLSVVNNLSDDHMQAYSQTKRYLLKPCKVAQSETSASCAQLVYQLVCVGKMPDEQSHGQSSQL